MKLRAGSLALFLSLALALSAGAQGIMLPVTYFAVQGAPFSLTIDMRSEMTRGKPGAATPPQHSTLHIVRDAAGRQRYEAPVVDDQPPSSYAGIYDVVAGKYIKLDLNAKTAEIAPMQLGKPRVLDATVASSLPPETPQPNQTLLGTRQIAGLDAWGSRTIQTLHPSQDITIYQDRELWRSTQYRMPLLQIIRTDRQVMTQTVVAFDPAEPDPALFQIPPGFTVSDAPPPPLPAPGTVRIGGDVSAPLVLKMAAPEISEQARAKKISGNVLVHLIVDENGSPQQVSVKRGVGYGLDEKAVECVKKYRFKPAMRNGVPVKVEINVEVNFQVF